MAREYEIWVCPDCGEQVSDELGYDEERNAYVRGHYHDPPEGWHSDDDPSPHPDPWFDAVSVTAIDKRDVEALREAAAHLVDLLDVLPEGRLTGPEQEAKGILRSILKTEEGE